MGVKPGSATFEEGLQEEQNRTPGPRCRGHRTTLSPPPPIGVLPNSCEPERPDTCPGPQCKMGEDQNLDLPLHTHTQRPRGQNFFLQRGNQAWVELLLRGVLDPPRKGAQCTCDTLHQENTHKQSNCMPIPFT